MAICLFLVTISGDGRLMAKEQSIFPSRFLDLNNVRIGSDPLSNLNIYDK